MTDYNQHSKETLIKMLVNKEKKIKYAWRRVHKAEEGRDDNTQNSEVYKKNFQEFIIKCNNNLDYCFGFCLILILILFSVFCLIVIISPH